MNYTSVSIRMGDLQPTRSGICRVSRNSLLNQIFRDVSKAGRFIVKLELRDRMKLPNPEDNGYLWFLSMTCPEIHLQENRENLNGISGLVTAFDLRTLLKDQDLYSPEDDLP